METVNEQQWLSERFSSWLVCLSPCRYLIACVSFTYVFCFVRDNYGFVTFANYDGACAAVERKLSNFLLVLTYS